MDMIPIIKKLDQKFEFDTALKVFQTKGNLVYEYNPFRNYRINLDMILYKNTLWTYEDFYKSIFGDNIKVQKDTDYKKLVSSNWDGIIKKIPKSETPPIPYQKGLLVDFETDELHFDINHPVDIVPQWSYDNSVNLIINDGKNPPRLINSRFSPIGRNKYQICDRKGNNDTNIYDLGIQFDIDTSLYRKTTTIPKLNFLGVQYGGNLSVGNYHFYFKYIDEDGNESDFFAESGLVSVFIGNTPTSIRSGFRDENSHKMVKFFLSNTDSGYLKIVVYYTKATSDVLENATVVAKRIDNEFLINQSSNTLLTITGFENTTEVPLTEINPTYQIYGSVETLDVAQNMLFLANVDKPEIPYDDLADCALRFIPELHIEEYKPEINKNYVGKAYNNYYDPNYIYNKVGYWDDEIYRFGVVFIQSDNTLTPVFNVRGVLELCEGYNGVYDPKFIDNNERKYISYNEETFEIGTDEIKGELPENSKGVISIKIKNAENSNKSIIGIKFKIKSEVLDYLKNILKIKGYFFVRQKRIPTTLCQAYTIALDNESHTPVIPSTTKENNENKDVFITESFLSQLKIGNNPTKILTHDFKERLIELETRNISYQAAICPDYDVNSPYLNSLFTGGDFVVRPSIDLHLPTLDSRHFYIEDFFKSSENYENAKIIGVEDNVKLVGILDFMFSARAGEAEEAFRFEYAGRANKVTEATNVLRGSYGPYLGITTYEEPGRLIDIKIPGYAKYNLNDYFKIRYTDKSSYYAISDRIDINDDGWYDPDESDGYKKLGNALFRGDCYICQFTHRINRNFQDPSAPINSTIVDERCWADNFEVNDGVINVENFDKINLGDLNAVGLGMWITFTVRSTMNLCIRNIDDSYVDETALTGHPRGFYPYQPMSVKGVYKVPEALCYNKGFEKALSEKWNFEVPDVPWIKNEFSNRIAYSNIQVIDGFRNGFRVFNGSHYRDYPKTYGSITKIIEFFGNLICVFEHGVALIPINERAVAGEGSGGNVYINTSNVLPENPKVLSGTFGSLWKESIIKTEKAVYGVDTVGRKIWRTNGQEFECISDFRVQEFLNKNISLTERELEPIIGIRNVKTHYNKFKGDVMFTFYDNLHGFEEKVWNLCWNEQLLKWITFYSWLPSYSENIYNLYFSFDRNTSKWISKLGISRHGNDFSDGVTLENNVISDDNFSTKLYLDNRNLPEEAIVEYELLRDNYGNYKLFDSDLVKTEGVLKLKNTYYQLLCSEYYVRGTDDKKIEFDLSKTRTLSPAEFDKINDTTYNVNGVIYNDNNTKYWEKLSNNEIKICDDYQGWIYHCVLNSEYPIYKDDKGRRINLSTKDEDKRVNGDKPVILLNIRAKISFEIDLKTLAEVFNNQAKIDGQYYESVVALIPEYNKQFLTTDFWKHGQAGIIDIADKIYPTYWYGKQHPFEFEFVVADSPDRHKIFDSLEIISNKAAPESFHYEIVGECYDFAKDKKNMYIRQEATKELYQFNGSDIVFNLDYKDLISEHRPLTPGDPDPLHYDKSTIFPLYYRRQDTINEIEDFYHLYGHKDRYGKGDKNFSALAGAEIVRYENLDEYRIWNHAKAVDIKEHGLLRGNMYYKEDKWYAQINPINLVQRNESKEEWLGPYGATTQMVPAEYNLFPIPEDIKELGLKKGITLPDDWTRNVVSWPDYLRRNQEAKIKDKFIKIRIRYSGEDLAIISAIRTLYSISYA